MRGTRMTPTKSFSSSILSKIAVALGALLLLGITLQPAMAKVRPVPPPPASSCSFTNNADDSLTLTATGLSAGYPTKAEAQTDVTVKLDGNTITSARINSNSYVATFTATGDYTATFKKTTSGAALKASCSGTIEEPVVADTTPPVISAPARIYPCNPEAPVEPCTGAVDNPDGSVVVTWVATATDAVDGEVLVYCNPPSGSEFPVGDTLVYCSATDYAGNSVVHAIGVTVSPYVNNQTAVLSQDGTTVILDANGLPANQLTTYTVKRDDIIVAQAQVPADGDGHFRVTIEDAESGTYTGQVEGSYTWIILEPLFVAPDTTAPVLTLPDDFTVEATPDPHPGYIGYGSAVVTYTATATDDVDDTVLVTCSPASGSTLSYTGTPTTRTVDCWAYDSAGNFADGSFAVTVVLAPACEFKAPGSYGQVDPYLYLTSVGMGTTETSWALTVDGSPVTATSPTPGGSGVFTGPYSEGPGSSLRLSSYWAWHARSLAGQTNNTATGGPFGPGEYVVTFSQGGTEVATCSITLA
jgi:hypothetical protein